VFAEILRGKNGIESRSAVLQTDRLDLFRGKDFARWCRDNPEAVPNVVSRKDSSSVEKRIEEAAGLLIRRGLLVKCQRKFLKPPPGQKRLIKFPKKVLPVQGPDSQKFDEAAFYCWTFDKPTPTWVYIVSALCAVGVILVCLFPVAPSWIKIGVVYMLSGLLVVLIGALLVRAFIALTSYIFTGNTVWVLPNVLDDNKPVSELFLPLIAIEEPDTSTMRALAWHWVTRVSVAGSVAALTWVLYTHSPGQEAVKRNAFKYRDELFEFLNVHNTRNMISKGNETAAENTTASMNSSSSKEEL